MDDDADRYEAWYTTKLWSLLPEIYRAGDVKEFGDRGPLREIVNRIGVQAAVVRRAIDRLWDDQSIETCDDWVISYIGDLLATNLVPSLDARGQRVDVAKTINYRRRKGTVGLLEELASDITGWRARVVEFYQRLGRTRHGLDPEIGSPVADDDPRISVRRAQRLIGQRTGTSAGGYADLRNVAGAELTNTAFDEFFHMADLRRGRGMTGWYCIPRIGVFVWRHRSLCVLQSTPVADCRCPNHYTFDPTGRDIPLYAVGEQPDADQWVSPDPHQLPGPIGQSLFAASLAQFYREGLPSSLSIYRETLPLTYVRIPPTAIAADPRDTDGKPWIDTTRGRLVWTDAPRKQVRVGYCYGFSSDIGAGPYDRCSLGPEPMAEGATDVPTLLHVHDGIGLRSVLDALGPIATVVLNDSLTYEIANVTGIHRVELLAKNQQRPVMRLAQNTEWTLTGTDGATLTLDGLFISGGDLVLKGSFEWVRIRCCTLDPGTRNETATAWQRAADGRPLGATRLRVEGRVNHLVLERCIVGPILSPGNGQLAHLTVNDSILQAADANTMAIDLTDGDVALSRTTMLGQARIHRIEASECILHERVVVDDCQQGCVRFTAWSNRSRLPRKYESLPIENGQTLFSSREFGKPDYAQLLPSVGTAISEGAEDGSEMGAFAREKNAIKERSLLIKYQEYLPLGLEPVVIHVT